MAQAKYNQIFQTLRGRIDSGAYGFLELLPSENTLAEEFTCTRNTVRKALALLVAQGYVQTMQGRGIQVISRTQPDPSEHPHDLPGGGGGRRRDGRGLRYDRGC